MSSRFFQKIDGLPLVRLLQASAALIFIWSVASVTVTIILQYSGVIENSKTGEIWFVLLGLINALLGAIFSPLILLALAEIIKIRQKTSS